MSPTLLILSILCWFGLLRLPDMKRDNWPVLMLAGYVFYLLGYVYLLRPGLLHNFELEGVVNASQETIGRYAIICGLAYIQGVFYKQYMKRDVEPLYKVLSLANLWAAGVMFVVLLLYKASAISEGVFSMLYSEVFSFIGFGVFMTSVCQFCIYFIERANAQTEFDEAVDASKRLVRLENVLARVTVAWSLSLFVPFILYTMSNSNVAFVTSIVPFYILKNSRKAYPNKLPSLYLVLLYLLSLCYVAFCFMLGLFGVAFG